MANSHETLEWIMAAVLNRANKGQRRRFQSGIQRKRRELRKVALTPAQRDFLDFTEREMSRLSPEERKKILERGKVDA